ACQVLTAAPARVVERPATVDEDVLHVSTLGKERSSAAVTPPQPTLDRVTDHHNVIFRRLLVQRRRASLEQDDVAPDAVELPDPLAGADDTEAAATVQRQ